MADIGYIEQNDRDFLPACPLRAQFRHEGGTTRLKHRLQVGRKSGRRTGWRKGVCNSAMSH